MRSPRLGVPTAREARITNLSFSSTTTTTRRVGAPRAAVTEVVKVEREGERKGKERGGVLRVGVVCGGPSAERGISLNSARSVLDHIQVTIPEFSFWLFGCSASEKVEEKIDLVNFLLVLPNLGGCRIVFSSDLVKVNHDGLIAKFMSYINQLIVLKLISN